MPDDFVSLPSVYDFSSSSLSNQLQKSNDEYSIAKELLLNLQQDSGFFFGRPDKEDMAHYVGMPQGTEGHLLVIGGSGSGKSSSIVKPTLITWKGAMCVTDIKGELSAFYADLYQMGLVERPYIIFDPMQLDGIGYDPFYHLRYDGEANLVSNVRELVSIIHPLSPNAHEPFWDKAEQNILTAALLYYFNLGLSFSETILDILLSDVKSLCETISCSNDSLAKLFISAINNMKEETLAAFDAGLRVDLIKFSADPYISNALRDKREEATCFTWNDLEKYNIFLRIPEDKIEQWGGVINLMYAQLIRHLERRPDKYTAEGANNLQTLLLMDEFARFGKLTMITDAVATLRSKSVNLCLVIQSIAQLDELYGVNNRRIICDNCIYKSVLSANDPETQKQLSELIGVHQQVQRGVSEHMGDWKDITGYSRQLTENWMLKVLPHKLSTIKDVLLLSPYGFCRVEKLQIEYSSSHFSAICRMLLPDTIMLPDAIVLESTLCEI